MSHSKIATYSNSTGNKLLLPELKNKKQKQQKEIQGLMCSFVPTFSKSDAMREILDKDKCKCSHKSCLEKIFPQSLNDCAEAFLKCRSVTRFKTDEEIDIFIHEQVRVMQDKPTRAASSSTSKFQFVIEGAKVCRLAFCNAFNITVYALQKASDAQKNSTSGRPNPHTVRDTTDATINDYTFEETREIFRDNVIDVGVASNLHCKIVGKSTVVNN
jgi:hypothetical protein